MEIELDVSMFEPCEPLERTLKATGELAQGDYLKVIHRREPKLLYPMLERAGFDWLCLEQGADLYNIYIWCRDDKAAEAQVKTDAD
ncbi:MAG: DUF2249 domain-containing protein [Sedimenticola sp.]